MFGSKAVVFISDVSSDMDSGCSVRISSLEFVLPGLSTTHGAAKLLHAIIVRMAIGVLATT